MYEYQTDRPIIQVIPFLFLKYWHNISLLQNSCENESYSGKERISF